MPNEDKNNKWPEKKKKENLRVEHFIGFQGHQHFRGELISLFIISFANSIDFFLSESP